MNPSVQHQLIQIVQEALENILKHASARSVHVCHSLENGLLLVTVEDDGVGFDAELVSSAGVRHFGIETMRERAESIDGSLTVESSSSCGTRVNVGLPTS